MKNAILLISWLGVFVLTSIYWGLHLSDSSVIEYKLPKNSKLANSNKFNYFSTNLKGFYRGEWQYSDHTFEIYEKSQPRLYKKGGTILYKGSASNSPMQITIYDGNFSDNSVTYKLSVNPEIAFIDKIDESAYQYTGIEFDISLKERMSSTSAQSCLLNFEIIRNHNDTISLSMKVNSNSKSCSIGFHANLIKETEYSKNAKLLMYYLLVFMSLYISSLGSLLQIKRLQQNIIRSYKLSLVPPTYIIISNLSWLVYHLVLDNEETCKFFPIIYAHQIFAFAFFQYKLLEETWKARYQYKLENDLIDADISLQRYCNARKVKLILQNIIILLFSQMIFYYQYILLTVCACLWIPQIARTFKNKGGRAPHPLYIISSTVSVIALPLYFRGYSLNFQEYTYSVVYAILQIALSVAIALIAILQVAYRYNVFLPRCCMGASDIAYNYYTHAKLCAEQICPICFVDIKSGSSNELVYMRTPCDHSFHKECLEQWLKQKLECPTCRRSLPRVITDDGE